MTNLEIIEALGGPVKIAALLQIKVPSVYGWLENGIPDYRLKELAASIEAATNGAFCRKKKWPTTYQIYWPELANTEPPSPNVTAAPSFGTI
jgi:DNA-binding transcriptional regulator YdaS (Cro superfamily)